MYRQIPRKTRLLAPAFALLAIAVAAAGCGTGSTQSSSVRFINAVPNGGNAAFYANGNFLGTENFFNPSSYASIASGTNTFSFTLSNYASTSYSTLSSSAAAGASYTAVIMGRADEASTSTEYPQIQLVADDATAPQSGDIRLRIFLVAPDLTDATVLVNGTPKVTGVSYPSLGTSFEQVAGNLTIEAENSSGTAVTPSVTFSGIVSGHHYTAFVVETATTPTYNIELIDDTTNSLLTGQ